MIRRLIRKYRSRIFQREQPSRIEQYEHLNSICEDVDSSQMLSDYQWLYPDLQQHIEYHPSIQKWLDDDHQSFPATFLQQIHEDIYQFPLLSDGCIEKWRKELAHFRRWRELNDVDIMVPNSMNNYGLILSDLGAEEPFLQLMKEVISPIALHIYSDIINEPLTKLHPFVVEYGRHSDRDLGFHVDASDVTVNLCLGDEFIGSELYFEGRRCEIHRQGLSRDQEKFYYAHIPHYAIIHTGKHRHGTIAIEKGSRRNIILWCSMENPIDDSTCTHWCGEFSG